MNTPLVSILLPVRNGEPYLREAIQSVLDQTYNNWELLISENRSEDSSGDTIRSFADSRIKVFRQEQSLSMPENWDFVLQRASGMYWMVLGADDILEKDHLQTRVEFHAAHPSLVISSSPFTEIDSTGRALAVRNLGVSEFEDASHLVSRMLESNQLNILTVFCKTEPVRKAGLGFDSRFIWFPDLHLWLRLLLDSDGVRWCKKNTLRYRIHPASINSTLTQWGGPIDLANLLVDVLERYPGKFRRLGIDPVKQCKTVTMTLWLNAQQSFRARRFGPGREAWKLFRRYHGLKDFGSYAVAFLGNRLKMNTETR